MRFLLRLASGVCFFGALFAVGIASGWGAGRDTVSTETTTTAESTTSAETTTTETATTSTETWTRLGHDHGDDHPKSDRGRRGRSCSRVVEGRVGDHRLGVGRVRHPCGRRRDRWDRLAGGAAAGPSHGVTVAESEAQPGAPPDNGVEFLLTFARTAHEAGYPTAEPGARHLVATAPA